MSENNSTTTPDSGKTAKPNKPYADFPLTAHPAGVWCKKIRGKLHYFGKWDDPDVALTEYLRVKDDLHAGREPRPDPSAVTVKDLCNQFLGAKQERVDVGELSPRTWQSYKLACVHLVEAFGKARLVSDLGPHDFAALRNKLARRYGPHGLGVTIQCVRCACKYAYDASLIERPIRYGPGFMRPSKKVMRLHKAKQSAKLFTADEIHKLLDAASVQLKAMVLLGINCGFGNSDCGNLKLDTLDLDTCAFDYPRPKTGIARRCMLWPETVQALKDWLAIRKQPEGPATELVFVTAKGQSWHKDTNDDPISKEIAKLLHKLHINGRKGLGFYTLRHTFRTVADEAKDQPAADFMMGHESPHMSTVYRETISNARLKAVTDYVRNWLFAVEPILPAIDAVQ
jgi:integrase